MKRCQLFKSAVKNAKVKIGEKTQVYDLAAGKKIDLNFVVQQFKEQGIFDLAPTMSARVTVTVEHFVTGEAVE